MISIEFIRNDPQAVKNALERRGEDSPIDDILDLDRERRQHLSELEELRARRNAVSKQIGRMSDKPKDLIEEMRNVGDRISSLEDLVKTIEENLEQELLKLPNLPLATVPEGLDETGNVIIDLWGE